jgi:hypothetical protein
LNAAHRSEESSTPKQSKPPQVTTEHLVELINSQVPYLPDAETMCARLGRGYVASPKPAPTTSTTADWNALGLSAGQNGTSHNPPMDLPQDRSSSENLPSCSSGASSTSQPPPNEIVPEAPLGDEELDSMIQGNYSGLIRTGKLKKRRKKVKEQPPAEVNFILIFKLINLNFSDFTRSSCQRFCQ